MGREPYESIKNLIETSLAGYLSEQGLNKTKDAFSKESPDLLESDVDNDMNKGQKLSLIIEEYFLLKKIGKCFVIPNNMNLHFINHFAKANITAYKRHFLSMYIILPSSYYFLACHLWPRMHTIHWVT